MNTSAYDILREGPTKIGPLNFSPHPAYEQYLKIHKIQTGPKTSKTLEQIADQLAGEALPRYQSAAGWAALEAALGQPDSSIAHKNKLLTDAESYWVNAIETQLSCNASEKQYLIEHSAPFRYALDLAHLPLYQGIISGNVTENMRSAVISDTLAIAESNIVQMSLACKVGDQEAISDHSGFGYEANALLAFHSFNMPTFVATPGSARADSGHHHPKQTHDILVIQQKWGEIRSITPIEIKAAASQRDRKRYKALIMRGKMHLTKTNGSRSTPEITLKAFSSFFSGQPTIQELEITNYAQQNAANLYWLYRKGNNDNDFTSRENSYMFKDKSNIYAKYPELKPN